jgi:Cdc6-like AAA superfamily ATPase
METILSFLATPFLGYTHRRGKADTTNSALYVCGVPGVGKTAGVRWCCKEIQTLCTKNEHPVPNVCYINAAHLVVEQQSNPEALILKEIGSCLNLPEDDCTYKKIMSTLNKNPLILIIDEIDVLVSTSSRGSASETLITSAAALAHDPNTNMVLIGISNSMTGNKYDRIRELGKVSRISPPQSNTLNFVCY